MDTQRKLFFQEFETFGLGQTNWAEIFFRHLGYFRPKYQHCFGTVSPLSMGKCSWFSPLQKSLVFRSKTYNSQKNLGNSVHTVIFSVLAQTSQNFRFCFIRRAHRKSLFETLWPPKLCGLLTGLLFFCTTRALAQIDCRILKKTRENLRLTSAFSILIFNTEEKEEKFIILCYCLRFCFKKMVHTIIEFV